MNGKTKVITFFNEKGGTGKTTFTALFACWLAYRMHEKVYVMDMDYPLFQLSSMRNSEVQYLNRPESAKSQFSSLAKECREWYFPVMEIGKQETFSEKELAGLAASLKINLEKAGSGYFLLDFPGRYLPNDPIHYLSRKGLIDLVVFPIDTDRQSRGSALSVYSQMKKHYENPDGTQEAVFLWNKESPKERIGKRDWYSDSDALYRKLGIPVVGGRMRDILIARRDPSVFGFIRNTMCWPGHNIAKACPYIESIFTEIKSRVDGTWNEDMKETLYGKKD